MRTKVSAMAMAAALLSAPLAIAEMESGTPGTEPGASAPAESDSATKGRGRDESRRSGVPGTEEMAPGSGAQGVGTENGPDGSGLTGSEGQDDEGDTHRGRGAPGGRRPARASLRAMGWVRAGLFLLLTVRLATAAPIALPPPDGWRPLTLPKVRRRTVYTPSVIDGVRSVRADSDCA